MRHALAVAALLLAAPLHAQGTAAAKSPTRAAAAAKQAPDSFRLTSALPVDPAVRVGTLPNGMRYYVRRNAKPEQRAELRLVVNGGSIL